MWNETPEVVKVREALGLFSSLLLKVAPAAGLHAHSSREAPPLRGLVMVFEHVCVFDPNAELKTDDAASASETGLCRWFSDRHISVAWNETATGMDIVLNGETSFSFVSVDDSDAVFNALTWMFDWEQRQAGGYDVTHGVLGAVLYPETTRRLRDIVQRRGETIPASPTRDDADDDDLIPTHLKDDDEFVVADLDGAIVTNHRLFFATTVVALSDIDFMMHDGESIVITLSKTLHLRIRCSVFRQSVLMRKWLLSVLEHAATLKLRNQPRLLTMTALHRQFCAVNTKADGYIDEQAFRRIVTPIFSSELFASGFFKIMDADGNGEISFAEFAVGLMDLLSDDFETRMRFTFALFDINGDGAVEAEEMLHVLEALQHTGDVVMTSRDELLASCEQLFALIDANGDGRITMEEYDAAFNTPSVYNILCHLGLAGDRSLKRARELSAALVTPNDAAWALISTVLHGLRVFIDHVYVVNDIDDEDFVETAAIPCQRDAAMPGQVGVQLTRLKYFRDLHQEWHFTVDDLEESLCVDNVASNLLLGSPRLPTPPPEHAQREGYFQLVTHDKKFVIFEASEDEFDQLRGFMQAYTEYILRSPNSLLSRIVALLTVCTPQAKTRICVFSLKHTSANFRLDVPGPITAHHVHLDGGWRRNTLGQLQSDAMLLQTYRFVGRLCITSRASGSDLHYTPPKNDGAEDADQDHKKVKKAAKVEKTKTGGCCSGSAVKTSHRSKQSVASKTVRHVETFVSDATSRALSPITAAGHELEVSLHLMPNVDPGSMWSGPLPVPEMDSEGEWVSDFMRTAAHTLAARDTEKLPTPTTGQQCVTHRVVMFNGCLGDLTLDKGARILYLTTQYGRTVLSVSLRMTYGLGFVRAKFPQTKMERQQLLIRAEPNATGSIFNMSTLVMFQSVEDLEAFTSDVYRGAGTANLSGMQLANLNVVTVHWNVGGSNPPKSLGDLFGQVSDDTAFVVVSASQCVFQSPGKAVTLSCEEDWTMRVMAELPGFMTLRVASCGATRLIVACRPSMGSRVSNIDVFTHSLISEGGRAAGNAICCSLAINNTTAAFVAIELAPGSDVSEGSTRLENFFRAFSKQQSTALDVLSAHQHVFLLGDFNFGTTAGATEVVSLSCRGHFHDVQKHDNLTKELRSRGCLYQFHEPRLSFPPTSYFARNVISSTRHRIFDEWHHFAPSWSSRILYKSLGHPMDGASRTHYDAVSTLLTSPHNAVVAAFVLPTRQQYVMMNVLHQPTKCHKLLITELRCEGLAAEDMNGTSDPVIQFSNAYIANPTDAVTSVQPSTLNPVWNETFELLLQGVESALFTSSYLSFIITDVDARGTGDALGAAVTGLHVIEAGTRAKRAIELPVMRFGQRHGTLKCTLRLLTV